jgi:hypothetical protein
MVWEWRERKKETGVRERDHKRLKEGESPTGGSEGGESARGGEEH